MFSVHAPSTHEWQPLLIRSGVCVGKNTETKRVEHHLSCKIQTAAFLLIRRPKTLRDKGCVTYTKCLWKHNATLTCTFLSSTTRAHAAKEIPTEAKKMSKLLHHLISSTSYDNVPERINQNIKRHFFLCKRYTGNDKHAHIPLKSENHWPDINSADTEK